MSGDADDINREKENTGIAFFVPPKKFEATPVKDNDKEVLDTQRREAVAS